MQQWKGVWSPGIRRSFIHKISVNKSRYTLAEKSKKSWVTSKSNYFSVICDVIKRKNIFIVSYLISLSYYGYIVYSISILLRLYHCCIKNYIKPWRERIPIKLNLEGGFKFLESGSVDVWQTSHFLFEMRFIRYDSIYLCYFYENTVFVSILKELRIAIEKDKEKWLYYKHIYHFPSVQDFDTHKH